MPILHWLDVNDHVENIGPLIHEASSNDFGNLVAFVHGKVRFDHDVKVNSEIQ